LRRLWRWKEGVLAYDGAVLCLARLVSSGLAASGSRQPAASRSVCARHQARHFIMLRMSEGVFIPEIAKRFHVFLRFAKSILCHRCIHLTLYSLWVSVLFVTISGTRCWMYYTYRYIICTQETSIILMENISGVSVFNFENYETGLAYVSCESWNQWRYWFIQWTR